MSTRICPKCGFATMRPGPSAWECGRIIDCGYKDGDKLADADNELIAALAGAACYARGGFSDAEGCDESIVAAILAELRRRGAWLPGDPVTDAMAQAAKLAKDAAIIGGQENREQWRAAIAAALAARTPANGCAIAGWNWRPGHDPCNVCLSLGPGCEACLTCHWRARASTAEARLARIAELAVGRVAKLSPPL